MPPLGASDRVSDFQKKPKLSKSYEGEPCFLYADILNFENKSRKSNDDTVGESARNRFGRPYISGRPLLTCDRWKIIQLYNETGIFEARSSRTASCACPGSAEEHDLRICRHLRYRSAFQVTKKAAPFTVEWILSDNCSPKVQLSEHTNVREYPKSNAFVCKQLTNNNG